MIEIEKYKEEIDDFVNYLRTDLKELDFLGAYIFGSAMYEKNFSYKESDIDLIAFCKNYFTIGPEKIIEIIKKTKYEFKDKTPRYFHDNLGDRIEFYIKYNKVVIDLTICPPVIPSSADIQGGASYDSFDSIIGAIYLHGHRLFGELPQLDFVKKEVLPFYNDKIRDKRLSILGKRVIGYNNRLKEKIKEHSFDIFDFAYKARIHFIKWLFMYMKKYSLSPVKHIKLQMEDILRLPKNEIKILNFTTGNIYDASTKYLETSNKYLKKFFKENK